MLHIAAIAIVSASFAVGCGGSSSADPLTKSEFVQQANSICRDAQEERDEVLRDAANGDPALAELATDAVTPIEAMTEELAELTPPASEAKEADAIVAAFEAGVAGVKAAPADTPAAISAFTEASKLAEDYGLTDCVV